MESIISSLVTLAIKRLSLHAVMMATFLGSQLDSFTKLLKETSQYTMALMTLQWRKLELSSLAT